MTSIKHGKLKYKKKKKFELVEKYPKIETKNDNQLAIE
jgi:hypothetical protein